MALNFANNNSLSAITSLPTSVSGGDLTLISTQTASSSATIDFTSGIDSTYKEYVFKLINIHPQTDNVSFQFNFSTDGGSNYNVTKTTTFYESYNRETAGDNAFAYADSRDLAQSTSFQTLSQEGQGNDNDQNLCGVLQLFDPSSTTFVKNFFATTIANSHTGDYCWNSFIGGYGNTTSAVNAIQFKMSSGNTDLGIIKMYGVS